MYFIHVQCLYKWILTFISIAGRGASIVEMLFCTSLVALVGVADQEGFNSRQLQIINTKVHLIWLTHLFSSLTYLIYQRQSTICELTFPTTILAVKMNRRRLIVVLEEQIFLYDISNMKLLHTIDTRPNPTGKIHCVCIVNGSMIDLYPCVAICALSPSSENCYIAYPSRSSSTSPFTSTAANATASGYASGDVEIFDALNIQLVNIVQAHKSPVSCITMNSEGTLLATASEKVIHWIG